MIKGILIHYDEIIDTNGFRWAEVIWEHFQKYHLPVNQKQFLAAFDYAQNALRNRKKGKPFQTIGEEMEAEITYQFDYLRALGIPLDTYDIRSIAEDCVYFADYTAQHSIPVLQALSQLHSLAVITHTQTHLQQTVTEFGLTSYFKALVVSPTDNHAPGLYRQAARELALPPEKCLVVASLRDRHLSEAKKEGFHTVGLASSLDAEIVATGIHAADAAISDLMELPGLVAKFSALQPA
jgi:HAD superfamily hydrolase (TIGR01509 family)